MSLGGARQRHKKDSEGLDKSGRKKEHPGPEKSTEHWIRNENFPTEKQDNDGKIKYFFQKIFLGCIETIKWMFDASFCALKISHF